MRSFIHIILLAVADYRREKLLSLCSVLGLTAVLAPLLILYGVKFGVMATLNERLLSNPYTLEISPVQSGSYTKALLSEWARLDGVQFVLPRTRSLAATMKLTAVHSNRESSVTVSLEPTAKGDPLLLHYGIQSVTMVPYNKKTQGSARDDSAKDSSAQDRSTKNGSAKNTSKAAPAADGGQKKPLLAPVPKVHSKSLREAGCVLSQPAAAKLGIHEGDSILGKVERSDGGTVSSAYIRLLVTGILPVSAQQKAVAYIPLELMVATEDFRDHREVPELGYENGWTGDRRPDGERVYSSFRLYARNTKDVAVIRDYLATRQTDTYTHAEEIEQLDTLEKGLMLIFTLICATAGVGFFLSTASNVFAGIKRKERTLGLLQLTGFSTGSLVFFPMTQAILTAILGSTAATGAYMLFSSLLNHIFSGALGSTAAVCMLTPIHFVMAFLLAIGISFMAALGPSIRSTRIEPSEVIRDV